jgi:hypothetical protein
LKSSAFIFLFFLIGCSFNNGKEAMGTKEIARAGDEVLSASDFASGFVSTGIVKDSLYNAKKSIEKWATDALFYQEAVNKLNNDEINIDREISNYRKVLVNYIYENRIIEANLDTTISNNEIQQYYDAHRDNFILKSNIVKVNYFKIPLKAPALDKIRKLTTASRPKDIEQLRALVTQNAENSFMNDSTWLFLEDIQREIPRLREQEDINISAGRVLEFEDEEYYYYLKVKDVKIKNGLSPINFEKKNIRKFIINSRKTQLISSYRQSLLDRARADKKFVIY